MIQPKPQDFLMHTGISPHSPDREITQSSDTAHTILLSASHGPASLPWAGHQDHNLLLPWWLRHINCPTQPQIQPLFSARAWANVPRPCHMCPTPAATCGPQGLPSRHHVPTCSPYRLPQDLCPTHSRLILHKPHHICPVFPRTASQTVVQVIFSHT